MGHTPRNRESPTNAKPKQYMKTTKSLYMAALLAATLGVTSCSLEEDNPGGFTMEDLAVSSESSYQTIVNNIYFGMERAFYASKNYMELTEGDTDLWTYRANINTSYTEWFWFFAGGSTKTTFTKDTWDNIYDGIGSCNQAITLADKAPISADASMGMTADEKRNYYVAQAKFMRAVYYFNAVELFGGATLITEPTNVPNYAPSKSDPMTIYKEIIIPDLEFAAQWLAKGDDATTTIPTKKSALGMLAKACLQTKEYGTDEYLSKGMEAAQKLITDCEGGGSEYGAYMYPTLADVFADANNWGNKEALWKHRFYVGSDGHGCSNGNYKTNQLNEKFLCPLSRFGARVDIQSSRTTWEGSYEGIFMPTQHLLSLYVQDDGTLDPRFHQWFSTQWNANVDYTWSDDDKVNYDKDASVVGKKLAVGDLAIKITVPQDADYDQLVSQKASLPYLLVDYKDVYDDQNKNVRMTLNGKENLYRYFYPSLNKHNSAKFYVVSESNRRNANLNATFMMRMAEVYLIAAELDIYLNGGANAAGYLNKVKLRAGAKAFSGTPTVRDVLDERGRELCGEYSRYYDLKRMGLLKDASYLSETHPDLAQYFKAEYVLKPYPLDFINSISNGAEYQNPGY